MRPAPSTAAVQGVARVDGRTKNLLRRIHVGEVAVIDHQDLDRVAAEGLVQARVGAVVNAAASISGRYPNVGPLLLAAAGIPLVDNAGPELLETIREGQLVRVDGDEVRVGGEVVAKGQVQTLESLEALYDAAKVTMGDELERFAENTLEFMRRERHVWIESPTLPDLAVDVRGRHVLIVVRGADHRNDLAHLRGYVGEMRPVLIGVDGGADALIEAGLKPDLIVGDFDSVTEHALHCGAQLVVHAYPDGTAPGAERLEAMDLDYVTIEAAGTSEDIAMLLAYEKGAELLVAVGTHASMVDFLDKGRSGMASTFLVRMKVGTRLVDAKGVSQLYKGRIRKRDMLFFLAAAMLAFVVLILVAFPRVYIDSGWFILRQAWRSITH
ncbi:MAG TPA: putative cytokinetic ring protein SteA [Acidimicrobiales bacterium]|nr:putative cytokinetic ring protein SteA [Acidimicrobiales bacterium]